MREVAFLKQNAEQWQKFEALLEQRAAADPDALAELFVRVTDDLAYAKTFYPASSTTAYLNTLAGRVHQLIYRNKKERSNRFPVFWQYELPALMRESRMELLCALAVFLCAALIGALSAANDDGFVRLIMGDTYVNMTLENIEHGDPLAVYKKTHAIDMFFGITFNNIRVALFAFVAGVAFAFGTALILFYNGLMLGAFQYFFHQQGLLLPSLLTIWIHGTLEISAIIIAGAAGFVMGRGLLFPGTFSRGLAFKRGAKNGLKIVLGLIPVFVAAGFLEGFVTRHTEMPATLSLGIIALSLLFVVAYFIIYPACLKRREEPYAFNEAYRISPRA